MGDFYSISENTPLRQPFEEAMQFFSSKEGPQGDKLSFEAHKAGDILFVRAWSQYYTDLDKGIMFALERGPETVILVNVMGGQRTDHTLHNFSVLKKLSNTKKNPHQTPIYIKTAREVIEFAHNTEVSFQGYLRGKVGIFGFPAAVGKVSTGLKWPLQDQTMELGGADSSCNEIDAEDGKVSISIEGEAILVRPSTT